MPLLSVMHGQCDARPMVAFPAAGHRRCLAGTDLYCLVNSDVRVNTLHRVASESAVAWIEPRRYLPVTFVTKATLSAEGRDKNLNFRNY